MIYVIGEGEYSDWDLIGYTTSKEEAQIIVAEKNENDSYCWTWYKELEEITQERMNKPKVLQLAIYDTRFSRLIGDEKSNLVLKEISEIKKDSLSYYVRKTFPLGTSEEKMLKVCRDMIAEYKAKEQGLC